MTSISVQVSKRMLQSLTRRAMKQRQSLEKEVVALIATGLKNAEVGIDEVEDLLQPLELMPDDDLWNAARSRMPRSLSGELEKLHQKRQRDGISKAERERARLLTEQFERCVVIRARAIELLHARGHDVSALRPS